jgi:GH15 family glucan-1,4-alpha-glucosidase
MVSRIEDYALIGDCETAALVARDGSVDWLCWPRFDSEACFAALLGSPRHGRWLIAPVEADARIARRYRDDTLILETTYETSDGTVTLIDFMPLRGEASDLVRIVRGDHGRVRMRMDLTIRFGYGRQVPWVTRGEAGELRAVAGPDLVVLRTPVAVRGQDLTTVAEFTAIAGETTPFVLSYGASWRQAPQALDPQAALRATEKFWHEWISRRRRRPRTPWPEHTRRSLITLKALAYAPTGGIVAAPTTSLPERLGGARNWDYRYCWVRDATLTLLALMNAGYYDEAQAWRDWLLRAVAGDPQRMQIMYGVGGEEYLPEWELPWLPGYEGATPVRIGNAAHEQLQLDVYGELMDALHHARRGGLVGSESAWAVQRALMDHLETIWDQPDEGIWEIRSGPQQFTYSKLMAWVALDRALKGIDQFGLDGPADRWAQVRDRIHDEVCRRAFCTERNSFVRTYGSTELDASLLLLPQLGFLPCDDPRVKGTIEAIEQDLLVDGFVLRYRTDKVDDGMPSGEGAFLACSFWLADAYVLLGREQEARDLFDRLCGLANDVGLLSEEYDVASRRLVGNFPQAFSHVALINTADNIAKLEQPARQRSADQPTARPRSRRHDRPAAARASGRATRRRGG